MNILECTPVFIVVRMFMCVIDVTTRSHTHKLSPPLSRGAFLLSGDLAQSSVKPEGEWVRTALSNGHSFMHMEFAWI